MVEATTTAVKNRSLLCVVGARPNFMKIAPIMRVLGNADITITPILVHTGQHYGADMQTSFFEQLNIPQPNVDLEVGSASHAVQTAEIMKRFEPVLDQYQPSAVLVVGDVNSTIACGMVAVKKHIPLIHVEAGLRSYDKSMPEEINRVMTDQISDLLFTTERSAKDNLLKEGIKDQAIHFCGNVMVDSLLYNLEKATPFQQTLSKYLPSTTGYSDGEYCLLTLHRPATVDDPANLKQVLQSIAELAMRIPVVFAVHPRTAQQIEKQGYTEILDSDNIALLPALAYLDLVGLMKCAKFVLTDSGGLQEETTALGVPCLTLRENTERPITITEGTNTIVGIDPAAIKSATENILDNGGKSGRIPEYWDGHAAERIVAVLDQWLV
jgi:UDP-N-acetylglucosamine 2-epimerase (non-hydrolysing)